MATQVQSRGLSFAVADREEFREELEEEFGLGLSDGGELPFITIRTRAGHKYSMQEEFTYEPLKISLIGGNCYETEG